MGSWESTRRRKRTAARLKRVLRNMRLNIAAFAVLAVLAVAGTAVIRTALLQNAWDTGTALARGYAAEEQSSLAIYETLLSFGTASVDKRVSEGESKEELLGWMEIYFQRLEVVLGSGAVDPYIILDGEVLAANPWEEEGTYNIFDTEWYQKAEAADGEIIFTNVYTDAIYHKPVITAAQKCRETNAMLVFDIFPENIRFQFDLLDLEEGNSFFLCDGAGTIIYQQTDLQRPREEVQQYLHELIEKIGAGALDRYDASITDLDGKQRAVYYTWMDNGWISIVTFSYDNIMGNFRWITRTFGLVSLAFLAALIGMTWRDSKFSAQMERTNETVRVLGNSYYALYRIDFGKETYEMIKGSDYVRSRIPPSGRYGELLRVAGEVIEPEAYQEFLESFSAESIRKLVSKRVRDFGGDFLRRFGEVYRWVSVRVLFDESLAPGEVVLCFREVEQEKQRQLQEHRLMEDALEIARQNEASKQTFFSSMSHDMRTPLNAIIGLSDLAGQHTDDPRKTREYLGKINTSSRQLLGLINDILDMSRMEQGKVVLNNKKLDLRRCVEECTEAFRYQAEQEGKTLQTQLELENRYVMGDPFRITQILNNLLSNAFKFTGTGDAICVSVTQLDSGEYAKYKFVVSDTGIGMSQDFLPHLFEPYSRETRFSAKQTVGTGLGMPITKNLVSQMNGEIQVQSELGKGTSFTIVLPLAAAEEPQPAATPREKRGGEQPADLEGRRILLAEDNEVNMEIAVELLSMAGAQVTRAWNGQEAVERFQESEPFTFDAILMDMQMPVLDGCEAARRIRALSRPDAGLPIVAVTANAFAEDIAATQAAGMDAHISKPIDFGMLCRTLEGLFQRP